MNRKIYSYESDQIQVTYDVGRCIHAAECVRGLGEVFNPDEKPWIKPENSDAGSIAEVIHRCPTGALQYKRKDGVDNEHAPEQNSLELVSSGPVYARGKIKVTDSDGNEIISDTRVAFCRCGLSKDKPFCDNSHKEGFVADRSFRMETFEGAPTESDQEILEIRMLKDGPLLLKGRYTLQGENRITSAKGIALCRCGQSANKPFCDGTHKKIGFTG
ncbi:MAG: CDGSH iron-sulfur domain-containing protein [Cyclonatronaceae bacterium]